MAPMKELVTLPPSRHQVAGSRTTYFRILEYMLQNVMSALHQRDGSMYTNPPLGGHRIELYSTAQSMESANATLKVPLLDIRSR